MNLLLLRFKFNFIKINYRRQDDYDLSRAMSIQILVICPFLILDKDIKGVLLVLSNLTPH